MESSLYLDYAAAAPLMPGLGAQLVKWLEEDFANPSAAHRWGKEQGQKLELARDQVKEALGLSSSWRVIFTSSATESNNTILKGLPKDGRACWYFKGDHPSLLFQKSENDHFIEQNKNGELEWNLIDGDRCQLVALSEVDGQSGLVRNISKNIKNLKRDFSSIHFHGDFSQAVGKVPLDIESLDSVTISGQKIGAPKGISLLLVKDSVKFGPLLSGGGHEAGERSSTPSVPLAQSIATVLQWRRKNERDFLEKATEKKSQFKKIVETYCQESFFPFSDMETSPFILCFILPTSPSDVFIRLMEQRNIMLSSSSACTSKRKKINPVFSAINIEERWHSNVIRLSFGPGIDGGDLDYFEKCLKEVMAELEYVSKLNR